MWLAEGMRMMEGTKVMEVLRRRRRMRKKWRRSCLVVVVLINCLLLLLGDVSAAIVNTPEPTEDFSVKLVNGIVANTGLLLVFYQGSWGTVCDDLWDTTNAEVVCKQMGYPGAALDRFEEFQISTDYGSYPILLDGVNCTGSETHISSCQFNEPLDHDCKHEEDVYLLCQLPQPSDPPLYSLALRDGRHPNEGRLEIFYHGVWGTICDDSFTEVNAYVACRQMGYPFALSILPKSAYGDGAEMIMSLENVECSGSEGRLWDCDHGNSWTDTCNKRQDVVGIRCSQEPSTRPGRAMRLVPNKFGLVEIFHDGIWWNVCADSQWDRRDALVACRQRGYPSGLPHRQPICPWTTDGCHSKFGRFKCIGTENSLEECDFTTEDVINTWTCRDGFAVAECLYAEQDGDWFSEFNLTDISIFNSTMVPRVTKKKYTDGDVRLADSSDDHQGRVEIYHDNSWFTVCDDSWDIRDARVVCHQLGYPDAVQALSVGKLFAPGIVDILLDNVDCKGEEANLLECNHNELTVHDCIHNEDAAVICKSAGVEYAPQSSSTPGQLPPGAIIAISMISALSFIIIGGALLHYACKSCDRRIEGTAPPRSRSTPMVVMMVHSSRNPRANNGYTRNNQRYDALPFTICSRTSIASTATTPMSSPVSQNGTICEELEALSGAPPSYEIVLRHPDAFAQMFQSDSLSPPPSYNRCISQK